MGVVSAALIYGGVKCFDLATYVSQAIFSGYFLISMGVLAGVAAIFPVRVLERFYTPPRGTLYDRDEDGSWFR